MKKIQRVMCAVDLSDPSKTALEHAEALAQVMGAELIVLHVIESQIYPAAYGLPAASFTNFEEEATRAAQKALEPVVQAITDRGVPARSLVETGLAWSRISEVAEEVGADLVVVATHGWTGIKHALIGSTAERVVRSCKCPVLTVKLDESGS